MPPTQAHEQHNESLTILVTKSVIANASGVGLGVVLTMIGAVWVFKSSGVGQMIVELLRSQVVATETLKIILDNLKEISGKLLMLDSDVREIKKDIEDIQKDIR